MKKYYLLLILIILLILGYFSWPYVQAELLFQQSLKSTSPQEIYRIQERVLKLNPHFDYYHRKFSQTTLALADSIVSTNSTPSARNQQLIAKLIPQAISEAKTAVSLNPLNSLNSLNIGLLYKNLIGIIPKASDFGLAYLQQAYKLQPKNPEIQVQIANVYFLIQNYEQAVKFYENALVLDKNYAPAFWGLSQIAKNNGDNVKAMKYLTEALRITPKLSPDYIKIKLELSQLEQPIK